MVWNDCPVIEPGDGNVGAVGLNAVAEAPLAEDSHAVAGVLKEFLDLRAVLVVERLGNAVKI
ncbi:MAG: hypothetical protein AAF823_04910 [Planctomycetota bacterium]